MASVRSAASRDDLAKVPAGLAEGADGLVEMMRAAVELVPDRILRIVAVNAIGAHGVCVTIAGSGTPAEMSPVEFAWQCTLEQRDGLVTRVDFLSPHRLDAALARFRELSREKPPALENAATQELDRRLDD